MNASRWSVCIAIVCLIGMACSANGQDARLEAKIVEMEKRIRELEGTKQPAAASAVYEDGERKALLSGPIATESPDALPTAAPEPGPVTGPLGLTPAMNLFKDGFILQSKDAKNQVRITGQIQADSRTYTRHNDFADNDTFLVRRARLGIEATLFEFYEFRFLPDWGNNKSVIQDAYLNIHHWDQFQFQVGKFKEPVSFEQLVQDRFVPTVERSLLDQIVPARDVGLMFHGQKLFGGRLDYGFGAFNGEPNSDLDSNKIRDFAGRIAWRPFGRECLPEIVRPLQVGLSGSIGKEQEPLNFNGSSSPGTLRTPGNIPWLTFNNSVRADGIRSRLSPEVSYVYNHFGFAAQYLRMDQEMRSGVPTAKVVGGKVVSLTNDPVQNIRFDGYHFTATYLLTGETRKSFAQFVEPLRPWRPLSPFRNPGAWEAVARVSHMQVEPAIFNSEPLVNLAKATGNSDAATEMTLGCNWYLNSLVRMQFNWEHGWFQQPLLLGPGTFYRQTDAILVRFQVIF